MIISNVSSNNRRHLYLLGEQFTTGSASNVVEQYLVLVVYTLSNSHNQHGIIEQQTPSKLTWSTETEKCSTVALQITCR